MKKLLTYFLTFSFLSTTALNVISCANNKLTNDDSDNEDVSGEDSLKEEIKSDVLEYITNPAQDSDDGNGYIVKEYKDLNYNSFSDVNRDISNEMIIKNQDFKNKVKEHIIEPKIQSLTEHLKQKYDVFREQEEIVELEENISIERETIKFNEISNLIKTEDSISNNNANTDLIDDMGMMYKFNLKFTTKFMINNQPVLANHTLKFYVTEDTTKFTSIQNLLTNYVKNKISNFFKTFIYSDFSGNSVKEDIDFLIKAFSNSNEKLNQIIQNIFNKSNSPQSSSPLKIGKSIVLSSDKSNAAKIITKLTNYDVVTNKMFDILIGENPDYLNEFLLNKYQDYLKKQ